MLTTFTYDSSNRLMHANAGGAMTTYSYDPAGNRTKVQTPTDSTYYSWDPVGRMATAEVAAGIVSFTYNADGQRVAKQGTDGSVTGFLYDHNNLLAETDEVGGDVSALYTTGTDQEFGDLIEENGGQAVPLFNAQANTNALLDSSGNVQARYQYTAFGNTAAVSIEGDAWSSLSVDQWANMSVDQWADLPVDLSPAKMTGMGGQRQYFLDAETQLLLLGGGNANQGGRYYDPATTRFTSDDPIRQAGGINMQQYAGNDPIGRNDPSGHDDSTLFRSSRDVRVEAAKQVDLGFPMPQMHGSDVGNMAEAMTRRQQLIDQAYQVLVAEYESRGMYVVDEVPTRGPDGTLPDMVLPDNRSWIQKEEDKWKSLLSHDPRKEYESGPATEHDTLRRAYFALAKPVALGTWDATLPVRQPVETVEGVSHVVWVVATDQDRAKAAIERRWDAYAALSPYDRDDANVRLLTSFYVGGKLYQGAGALGKTALKSTPVTTATAVVSAKVAPIARSLVLRLAVEGAEPLRGDAGAMEEMEAASARAGSAVATNVGDVSLNSTMARPIGATLVARLLNLRIRQLELSYNAEQKAVDYAEGMGGARYEESVGRLVSRTNMLGKDVEGVDFFDPQVGPVSLKGPLGINSATGNAVSIDQSMVEGLAKSVIKDVSYNTASRRVVVDLKGLSEAQRKLVQDIIKSGVGSAPKKNIFYVN